ncbi:MAG: MFS transporter, partial [Pseudomonadota bacterium]
MSPAARIAVAVALGGFLMGFDASVISGVVGFIETEYALDAFALGWVVASLTLTAAVAMLAAGPLSDRYGRLPVLRVAAVLFAVSAVLSALAPDYLTLVLARMLGGFGVGAALIIAPVYIAELAPASDRGRLVSFNQLNIVVGISAAFFSNYLLLQWAGSADELAATLRVDVHTWRWMLGVEALPALLYLLALSRLPESPRWLLMREREADAVATLERAGFGESARGEAQRIRTSLAQDADTAAVPFLDLLSPAVRAIMVVALIVALVQQVTGINAVFFYAPMIFEQSGIGTDAAFLQAVLVGVVNLVFTVFAMLVIDRLGRRPLLLTGLAGIAACMM